jgi:hypothetical protein
MRRAQMRIHPELTVNERRDGFGRQMLCRTELPWRTDRRVALRSKLGWEPGERTPEHMSPVDHHQLLSISPRSVRHYHECSALPRAYDQ